MKRSKILHIQYSALLNWHNKNSKKIFQSLQIASLKDLVAKANF